MTQHGGRLLAVGALVVAVVVSGLAAQEKPAPAPAPNVAGKWSLSLDTPHGKVVVALELKVDGKKVTGTFTTEQRGARKVTGVFDDGRLTFTVEDETNNGPTFAGRFKDADTFVGTLTSAEVDMAGTALRVKAK